MLTRYGLVRSGEVRFGQVRCGLVRQGFIRGENMKLPGRPLKPETKKHIRRNITLEPENDKYVLGILAERKLEIKGHFSKVVNELIKDHRQVKAFKERRKAQARAALSEWE